MTVETITGTFDKQVWQNDYAVSIGEEKIDATSIILGMDLSEIHRIKDCDDTSDAIGRQCVKHDGPHSVYITEGICAFFGVEDVEDITKEMLEAKKNEMAAAPKREYTVLVQRKVLLYQQVSVVAANDSEAEREAEKKAASYDMKSDWCDAADQALSDTDEIDIEAVEILE